MPDSARDVLVTGIGLVSSLGEGPDAHWQALSEGRSGVDTTTLAPYVTHPIGAIEFDRQIPKKGDQRQMEFWQRIGTYAAGLALDDAGLKGNADILSAMDMIVAAGGGERDRDVDAAILNALPGSSDPDALLNERLMSDLRPTLFLAQLSNLLAGNISIVHGVTGSSRTLMGEEMCGVDAIRIATARIRAGQSDICLVGGAQSQPTADMALVRQFGGKMLKGAHTGVWQRGVPGALTLGAMGAFVILESRQHAAARGARAMARMRDVQSDLTKSEPGARRAAFERLWAALPNDARAADAMAVVSGATGLAPATNEERAFLADTVRVPFRATETVLGHGFEPQFILNLAIAVLMLQRGALPPLDGGVVEQPMPHAPQRVLVTGTGHQRGAGLAIVEAEPAGGAHG